MLWIVSAAAATGQAQSSDPLEQSLIEAWEQRQSSRPKTVTFERIEPGQYRFHTTFFPFDGRLRVVNVAIDEHPDWTADGVSTGVVEVELEGAGENFMTKHAHSYGMWSQDNFLYHDPGSGRWVGADEYSSLLNAQSSVSTPGPGGWSCFSGRLGGVIPLILLTPLVILVALLARKASRQMKTAMSAHDKALAEQARAIQLTEKAVQLSEDSNRVLKEILEAIKDSKL